jgi:gustatory receptor
MACDTTSSISKRTPLLCYKLQTLYKYDSLERKELIIFANEANLDVVKFTAADFFEINRGTFFGMLSAAATYFIIIIQFTIQNL